MTDSRHAITNPPPVLETTRRLAWGDQHPGDRCQRVFAPPVDVEFLLLEAASYVLTQLRVLRSLVESPADARTLVTDIHERAEHHGIAPLGAIGVTGVLAELLCEPSERELAVTLAQARGMYADDELLDGAASMLAATSTILGDRLGLDATEVLDEVVRHRGSSSSRAASGRRQTGCRRPRFAS